MQLRFRLKILQNEEPITKNEKLKIAITTKSNPFELTKFYNTQWTP